MFEAGQFTRIAEMYMDTVFRVAFNYLKDPSEADDVTQEVLLKLYRTDKCFESDWHIRNWLVRVTVNCCKKVFLSPWRKTEPIENYADRLYFTAPEHSELFYMTMKLPRKYRIAIYLYYYEEYSVQDIARILKIPKATVNTHLYRGRKLLKKMLTEEHENV